MSHFSMPEHVLTGKNALSEAVPYLKTYGKRAFIVTGKHVGSSPMMEQLKKTLESAEIASYVFDEITGEPTDRMIEEGVRLYRQTNCSFCIGIGGGSPMDAAKAIAVMVEKDGRLRDYAGKEIRQDAGKIFPPVAAIPTTAGTGSEMTKFTVITDLECKAKLLLKGECLLPRLAIVDPDFSMDMPKSVTAATGLDALTHAIEAYTSKKAFALTDIFAVSAVKRIMKYLPIAYRNGYDAEAREQMSLAAMEAGICINNSSVTLVHGMSRPIGALFHVPHGKSNAMLLKECLSFALEGTYERFGYLGRETGVAQAEESDREAAEKFLQKVEELCRICEIPTLREYGIEEKDFYGAADKMAEDAMASGSPGNTVRKVTKEDCITIYKKAYET